MGRSGLLLALLLAACAGTVAAQQRTCDFSSVGRASQDEVGGVVLITLSDPFEVVCSDGAVLRASSGTLNRGTRDLQLVGNVFFMDADRTLTADRANYNNALAVLLATGNVVFTNRREGSTLRGPELEYFRALPERPVARVIAPRRPHLTLRREAAAESDDPLELEADRVVIEGDDDLTATGSVVIVRADLRAVAEEARYLGATEALALRRSARIATDEYELRGEQIDATLEEGALQHLLAQQQARLTGEDLRVDAPYLELFFAEENLDRMVARRLATQGEGPDAQRPVALATTFRVEADSLDARLARNQLHEVVAIGEARAESIDSVAGPAPRPEAAAEPAVPTEPTEPADPATPAGQTAEAAVLASAPPAMDRDWIRGDTVTAFFAQPEAPGEEVTASGGTPPAPEPEEGTGSEESASERPALQRLLARGSAQSLYRVAPQEAEDDAGQKALNFLVGRVIDLVFVEGELELASVEGLERGLYLDPVSRSASVVPGGGNR